MAEPCAGGQGGGVHGGGDPRESPSFLGGVSPLSPGAGANFRGGRPHFGRGRSPSRPGPSDFGGVGCVRGGVRSDWAGGNRSARRRLEYERRPRQCRQLHASVSRGGSRIAGGDDPRSVDDRRSWRTRSGFERTRCRFAQERPEIEWGRSGFEETRFRAGRDDPGSSRTDPVATGLGPIASSLNPTSESSHPDSTSALRRCPSAARGHCGARPSLSEARALTSGANTSRPGDGANPRRRPPVPSHGTVIRISPRIENQHDLQVVKALPANAIVFGVTLFLSAFPMLASSRLSASSCFRTSAAARRSGIRAFSSSRRRSWQAMPGHTWVIGWAGSGASSRSIWRSCWGRCCSCLSA